MLKFSISTIALIVALVIIVGLAVFGIIMSKKGGKKCIGCPDGCSCGQNHQQGNSCGNNNQ